MNKSFEELASEMTIAWIKAVGDACAAGKFSGSWLELNSVDAAYARFFNTIVETARSSSE